MVAGVQALYNIKANGYLFLGNAVFEKHKKISDLSALEIDLTADDNKMTIRC